MSIHVLPSGAFTAMSTTSSSSSLPRRRTSTEPWSSVPSAWNWTLSTATGTNSWGSELSTGAATWPAASSSATVDASGNSTSACNPPETGRQEPIDHRNGRVSLLHTCCTSATEDVSFQDVSQSALSGTHSVVSRDGT